MGAVERYQKGICRHNHASQKEELENVSII